MMGNLEKLLLGENKMVNKLLQKYILKIISKNTNKFYILKDNNHS